MRASLYTAVAILASLIPTTAEAAVINGGFEDGLTDWEAIGDYRVETSSFGSGPVEGTSQAFLSTASSEESPSGNAVPATFISGYDSLEGFLGLSTFFGDASFYDLATAEPIEGSAIQQTFTADPGKTTLSFSWNFLTDESVGDNAELDFNDFAFVTLRSNDDSSFSFIDSLADTTETFVSEGSNTEFFEETGYKTFSYDLPEAGEYTLGIGVVDVGEQTVISGLLVDKVEAVPETESTLGALAMLFLGAGWTVSQRQRKLKKSKVVS